MEYDMAEIFMVQCTVKEGEVDVEKHYHYECAEKDGEVKDDDIVLRDDVDANKRYRCDACKEMIA